MKKYVKPLVGRTLFNSWFNFFTDTVIADNMVQPQECFVYV